MADSASTGSGPQPQLHTADGVPVPQDLVLVGHVAGAFGIKGWVRIRPYSTDADALLNARVWWLDKPALRDVDVMHSKVHGEEVVAQLVGVADRNAAEGLKGAVVQVPRSRFPALDKDEYYWVDLLGLAVENTKGESLGSVTDLMDNGAHPILVVSMPQAGDAAQGVHQALIPFVDQYVLEVDQAGKRLKVDWERDY